MVAARILVVMEYKTGRSVTGPVYLGEDPLRLARCDACGSLQTPHTVTRTTCGAVPRISLM